MRKRIKEIIFPLLILVAAISNVYSAYNLSVGMRNEWNFEFYLKNMFLFIDKSSEVFREIIASNLETYFAILAFSVWFIAVESFGVSTRYRSLLIQRYESKKKFLFVNQTKGLLYSGIISLWIGFCILIAYTLKTGFVGITTDAFLTFILQIVNVFAFLSICSMINIFCVVRFGDIISIITVMFITFCILFMDVYVKQISILAYGTVSTLIGSLVLQIVIYFLGAKLFYKKFESIDLL